MSECGQEMCPNWSGDGRVCPCVQFGIEPPGNGHLWGQERDETDASEAAGLRAELEQIDGDQAGAEAFAAMPAMLRELREVMYEPDDNPRRIAAIAEKLRVLDLIERSNRA